jgi:hypothetical protein
VRVLTLAPDSHARTGDEHRGRDADERQAMSLGQLDDERADGR